MLRAHTAVGGMDLYHGVPDLQGAVISNVTPVCNKDYYETKLELTRQNGTKFDIVILQDRV